LLNGQLQDQAFIAGDQLSMADIPLACEVHRWWGLPQNRPNWPHLERWYAQMRQHPGAVGVLDLTLS
jgi:glutathione S-transferase